MEKATAEIRNKPAGPKRKSAKGRREGRVLSIRRFALSACRRAASRARGDGDGRARPQSPCTLRRVHDAVKGV
eukprot:4343390-Pleurochrysis_carterae.AAC.2